MDQATIQRYQPGGDLYQTLAGQYGTGNADAIAAAARTGDNNAEVAAAIAQAKFGAPLDDSTLDAFGNQLITDPLAAPLSGLNNLLGNTFFSFLKSPWVLLVIFAVVFFMLFDGLNVLRGLFKKK